MRLRPFLCVLVATAVAATTAGCGSDDHTTNTSTIDISKLDSGNYPIVPRDIEAIRTAKTGPALEAIRIGNSTPLPLDVDGRYSFQRLTNTDRRVTPTSTPTIFSLSDQEVAESTDGLIAGWDSSGERRKRLSLGRQANISLLRFSSAEQTEAAVRRLADRQSENLTGDSVQVPGFPQARAKWSVGKKYLDAWLTHDTMALYLHIEDPLSEPAELAPLTDFAQKYFKKQFEMLATYSPTPADRFGSLPIDVDGLLSRTLPLEEKERIDKNYDNSMVLPGQAALHFENLPGLTKAAFDDAGVDLVSFSSTRVFRARDAKSATRLLAAFADRDSDGYRKIDSPSNMPSAQCFDYKDTKTTTSRYPPVCFFAYDRYVARVTGHNPQELYQRTAAQYKLLAH
ncbi:hypothetical protein AB0M12_22440 [Nocardia vinacea]|uniref:DUF7373 family lipoprotein n=1 Tax=Nocardia vinacea TaxID=96468 RepID=UPI0034307D2F